MLTGFIIGLLFLYIVFSYLLNWKFFSSCANRCTNYCYSKPNGKKKLIWHFYAYHYAYHYRYLVFYPVKYVIAKFMIILQQKGMQREYNLQSDNILLPNVDETKLESPQILHNFGEMVNDQQLKNERNKFHDCSGE